MAALTGCSHVLQQKLSFHPFQPFVLGQKNLAPKLCRLSTAYLWFSMGESESEYGNPIQDAGIATQDWHYTADDKSDIYLGGVPLSELFTNFGLEKADLNPYLPADPENTARVGTEVHHLGYYLKWHPQECYYYAQENIDFHPSPERTLGTYSKYNSIDDKLDDFHYYTTFIKFGIGRATYDAAQEIRSEDITRDEGIALVKKYDGEFPSRFAEEIYAYLSLPEHEFPIASQMFEQPIMDHDYFCHLADRSRSPHLWSMENGQWNIRHTVFDRP